MRMRWLVVIGGMFATVGLASAASARPWVRPFPVVRVPGRVAAVTSVRAVRVARVAAVRPIRRGFYDGVPHRTTVVYPAYVAPRYVAPIRNTTVIASTPAVFETSSVPSNSLPSAAARIEGSGITILNPEATGGTVQFRLGGQAVRLESGFEQDFSDATKQVVEFDRGRNFGAARYTLTRGVYQFRVTPQGWDLVKKAADPPAEMLPAPGESSILTNPLP